MRSILALLLVGLAGAEAPSYTQGSELTPFALSDQHGRSHRVDQTLRALVFTRDMEAGAIVREALGDSGQALLARADAVYVSDISGMPAMIRRIFAMPRLRRRPYPILLDTEGEATRRFPGKEGRPTLLLLDRLRVRELSQPGSADELTRALRALAPGEPDTNSRR